MSTTTTLPRNESRSEKKILRRSPEGTAEAVEEVAIESARTLTSHFADVVEMLRECPPLRKPNRSRPIHDSDSEVQQEMAAWDMVSDEAWESIDD